MIKVMLKPFFKKFFGLFISMVFVSMLSVGLLCCFGSCIVNVRDNYLSFVKECQDMDEQITTDFDLRNNLVEAIKDVEGVERIDARLAIDCYLNKREIVDGEEKERAIVARVFSYNNDNTIFKLTDSCVIDKVEPSEKYTNISVSEKFFNNNEFKLGDTIELGFYNMWEKFYIYQVVDTPEAIYPRANNYIWSDNSDFGYLYASEAQLSQGLNRIVQRVTAKMVESSEYKSFVESAMAVAGITIPDLNLVDDNFASNFANQLMIKNTESADMDKVMDNLLAALKDKGINVKSNLTKNYMPHIVYMDHALEQVQIASIFLPVFFYSVTMIVVGLFINQIIKSMTPQIGVFMSIGINNGETVKLFLVFTIIMALVSGLLGAPVGYLLSILMAGVMKKTYSIPTITPSLNVFVTASAIVGLLLFVVATTLIATRAIFRITPKDATISNEAKRKQLPKRVQKFIDKAPMNIKLGVNSVCQNPRRFFVSSFSIFASLVLILLSTFFFVSKEEMIDQSVNRRLNYHAQVYLTQKEDNAFIDDLAKQAFVDAMEDCYYTYLKVDRDDGSDVYLECLAIDEGLSDLVNIPSKNGFGNVSVPNEGLVLPKASADTLKVKEGDTISINGHGVKIDSISYQYFHPITYLSKAQMDALEVDYVSSFILNINDQNAFSQYLSENRNQSLTVFTKSLSKDLKNIFDSTNAMIFIMVGFSLGMAFIILMIMSQNALMEQQRQLTIFRAVGFTIFDISNVWTLQSVSQLIVSSLFGVPVGALSIYILLRMTSSASQTYPFIFSWPVVFMAIGFVLLVVIMCHLISMISIKKWNIADNTRSRE